MCYSACIVQKFYQSKFPKLYLGRKITHSRKLQNVRYSAMGFNFFGTSSQVALVLIHQVNPQGRQTCNALP